MISKAYLEKITAEEFPDLKKTGFSMNHRALSLFSEHTLLPFLVFQNTTDSKNRLISLFLQPDSPGTHLVPFYVALGFYRKAANKALNAQDFYSIHFQPHARQVVVNGAVCWITKVDYLSQRVFLHGGNRYFDVPFAEDYRIRWQYTNAHELRESIAKFQRIQRASDGNIFSLQLNVKNKAHEGLIIFTHTSRFETLLGNVTISASSLKEHLHIQKTVFTDDEIKLIPISAAKTRKMPVTVLVSRPDTVFAYDGIIAAGMGRLDQLRTVVIEDFDILLKGWERSGALEENLALLDETYFKRLGSVFKNIYLVNSTRNFDLQGFLISHGIRPMAWMLKAAESRRFEELPPVRDIKVEKITTPEIDEALGRIEELISRWKTLAMSYFCGGEILDLVKMLYHTRNRLRTFYNRASFNATLLQQRESFLVLSHKWFPSGQDHGLTEETLAVLSDIEDARYELTGRVAESINSSLETISPAAVVVVSGNQHLQDREHLCALLRTDAARVSFMDEKTFLAGRESLSEDSLTVFLGAGKELINMLLTDGGDACRIILTDARGHGFLRWYARRAQAEIDKISPVREQCELLNLSQAEATTGEHPAPPQFLFSEETLSLPQIPPPPMAEEEETVREIIWEVVARDGIRQTPGESYVVFFEDGSQMGYQHHQSLFLYQENTGEENDEPEREVRLLRAGDQVIVPKSRVGIRKLLSDALASHESYAQAVYYDLKWRKGIQDFINLHGDVLNFMATLNKNDFPIAVPDTIRKWIDGETLQPNNFRKLIQVLVRLGIIEDRLKDDYIRESRELKRIKSRFVKSAILKLIYTFKNISHGWQEDIFDDRLLDSFIDHVEIKTVLTVIAK